MDVEAGSPASSFLRGCLFLYRREVLEQCLGSFLERLRHLGRLGFFESPFQLQSGFPRPSRRLASSASALASASATCAAVRRRLRGAAGLAGASSASAVLALRRPRLGLGSSCCGACPVPT